MTLLAFSFTVCSHVYRYSPDIKLYLLLFLNLSFQRCFIFVSLQSTYTEIYGVQIFTFVFSRDTRKPVKLSTLGCETDPLHIKHLPQTRCKNSTVSNYCINRPGNWRLWQKSNTQEQNVRYLKGITINTLTARPSDQKRRRCDQSSSVIYLLRDIKIWHRYKPVKPLWKMLIPMFWLLFCFKFEVKHYDVMQNSQPLHLQPKRLRHWKCIILVF